jgi:hypothetical protein
MEDFHRLISLYDKINNNLNLFLKLYHTVVQYNIKPSKIANLVKNSNELANIKTAIQIKRNDCILLKEG